jgi:hypothetical protein
MNKIEQCFFLKKNRQQLRRRRQQQQQQQQQQQNLLLLLLQKQKHQHQQIKPNKYDLYSVEFSIAYYEAFGLEWIQIPGELNHFVDSRHRVLLD